MESLLTDEWLGDLEREPILDEASVAVMRERVRERGAAIGMPAVVSARLVNVVSELGHNQLRHARGGAIALRTIVRDAVLGLEVIAADRGDGIAHPTNALRGEGRSAPPSGERSSLGIGMGAILELAHEVDFDVRLGEGTCVWARVFSEPVPRRRELAIFGRPCKGELVSGDDASFVRTSESLLLAVADGLGHGPPARKASQLAVAVARDLSDEPLHRVIDRCHEDLSATRGAVLALSRIPEASSTLETTAVGNATVHVYGSGKSFRATGTSAVLGSPGPMRTPKVDVRELASRDVLVVFTDGLTSRMDVAGELDLLREHPLIIAHQLLLRFGRDNDDALVAVAR